MKKLKKTAVHFIKFGVVGGIGTVINLAFFFLVVDLAGLEPNTGSILAFLIAVTNNYILNENWTFRVQGQRRTFDSKSFMKYAAINAIGLGINLIILNLFIQLFQPALKLFAQAAGIAGAMIFNFASSKLLVFRER